MPDWAASLFDWDEANIRHIAEHGVSPPEAEQALMRLPLEVDSYIVDGELRFEELGQTEAGRILKVVSVQRGDRFRIVTAFDASALAKRMYLRSMLLP